MACTGACMFSLYVNFDENPVKMQWPVFRVEIVTDLKTKCVFSTLFNVKQCSIQNTTVVN